MGKSNYPMTRGVRALLGKKIPFEPYLYPYEEHGGSEHAAQCLNVEEHRIIKTLVMEPEGGKPFLVLMHGDRAVSTKNLARALGVKSVAPCDAEKAERVTGYQVGGISPFGTRQPLPVYVERTVLALDSFYINAGKRGFLVALTPASLRKVLSVREVEVAISP
jgi:Cys-tRNA(Pro) deacylase